MQNSEDRRHNSSERAGVGGGGDPVTTRVAEASLDRKGLFRQRATVLQHCLMLIDGKLLARRHFARAFSDDLQ